MIQYIADESLFMEVLARVPKVKKTLWIGSVNLTGAGPVHLYIHFRDAGRD